MTGRIIFAVLVLMFLGLQYKLWFDKGSVPRAHALEQDLADLNAKNNEAKQKNAVLDADVRDLEKAGEAIEERARNELGMVKKGETLFQVKEHPVPPATAVANPSASPSQAVSTQKP
ncbi:MAG: septum formation initiator family protein [Burkholderiales bacterium]|nr:septum formation initiator family protein [Burkholderiales bacterium]